MCSNSASGASVTNTSASESSPRQSPDSSVLPASSDSRSSETVSPPRSIVGAASLKRESFASNTETRAPQRANSSAHADAGTSRLYSTTRMPFNRLPSDTGRIPLGAARLLQLGQRLSNGRKLALALDHARIGLSEPSPGRVGHEAGVNVRGESLGVLHVVD